MKIKMKQSLPGAIEGGLVVKRYKKDMVYDTEVHPVQIDNEVAKTFIDIGAAEIYEPPIVEGHRAQRRVYKSVGDAPSNKMESVKKNKAVDFDFDFFKDMKAGQIRTFAVENNIDLMDLPANTSAIKLAQAVLKRMK